MFLLFSCNENNNKKTTGDSESSAITEGKVSGNDFVAFSVPSPTMIASSIKLLEMDFNENLVFTSTTSKNDYPLSKDKAMNLGISLVDLGYAALYNQNQTLIKMVGIVSKLTAELNIENKQIIEMTKKFEENLNNQDSLMQLLHDVQSGIDKYYISEEKHEMALLIVTGMFVEGLYFTCEYYKSLDKKKTSEKYFDALKQLLFQQRIHLSGITELMDIYNKDEDYTEIKNMLGEINEIFNSMSFSYTMDESGKNIQNVSFRRNYLPLLHEKVSKIRSELIAP